MLKQPVWGHLNHMRSTGLHPLCLKSRIMIVQNYSKTIVRIVSSKQWDILCRVGAAFSHLWSTWFNPNCLLTNWTKEGKFGSRRQKTIQTAKKNYTATVSKFAIVCGKTKISLKSVPKKTLVALFGLDWILITGLYTFSEWWNVCLLSLAGMDT